MAAACGNSDGSNLNIFQPSRQHNLIKSNHSRANAEKSVFKYDIAVDTKG